MMVYQEIRRGQFVVNVPVLAIIIFCGGALSNRTLRMPWALLGIFGSIALAWLWWSLAVPRWRQ